MEDRGPSLPDRAFAAVQRALPTRLLSWLMFKLTRVRLRGFKNWFIRSFVRLYDIDLQQAVGTKAEDYADFNAFFTRALKAGARPLDPDPRALLSPVDGTVSRLGNISDESIVQAKGHDYSVTDLLGGDPALSKPFRGGSFCTIYLAPNNYHRIHMPLSGLVREWLYVPGRLFSVNPATVRALPGLFARNERVVTIFDSAIGPFALVLVGALFVGSMETVWSGRISPPHRRIGISRYVPPAPVRLARGEEMGRFNMGSTVILLSGPGALHWSDALGPGTSLRMGEGIARMRSNSSMPP